MLKYTSKFQKRYILVTCFLFLFFLLQTCPTFSKKSFANLENYSNDIYTIFDENDNVIAENNQVFVGDIIITKYLEEYEIVFVDDNNQIAYAEYNGYYEKPNITKKSKGLNFSNKAPKKSVGLYMTHNDESYVPTDGYSSIYGEGGIHDVANELKNQFEDLNYTVYIDETLHLPHNSSAYSRSSVTASSLLEYNLDALFDIHRDGVSRSVYVKNIDGQERCKVRIVIGQANPNKEANLQFAMYLVSVAEEYCPWLFLDIYYAKGHYNQALTSKGLLFEMGTYLAEKELVLDTTKYLAQVVDKTLFSTVVEEDNTLLITDEVSEIQQENLVNNILTTTSEINTKFTNNYSKNIVISTIIIVLLLSFVFSIAIYKKHKKKYYINSKKDT